MPFDDGSNIMYINGDIREAEGLKLGIQQGEEKKAIEDAKNALEMGLKPEQVSKIVSLPLEKVLELKKEIETNKA